MKLDHFLAAAFATTVLGLAAWSAYYGTVFDVTPAPAPSSSAPPLSTPSVLIQVDPKPVPSDEDWAIARKNGMLDRCQAGGGIPVIGYGWRVVCVKPSALEWWDDPKMPEKP